jgi:hypothetical protein
MSIKRTSYGIVGLGLSMIATFAPARAADPNFCGQYARDAMHEIKVAYENPNCSSRIGGNRWAYNYNQHFNWCMGAPYDAAQSERNVRRRFLDRCMHGG